MQNQEAHWFEALKRRLLDNASDAWTSLADMASGETEPTAPVAHAIDELVNDGSLEKLTRGKERLYRRAVVPSGPYGC